MKKLLFPFITATLIGITLLTSILAFSAPITHAASISGTPWQISVDGLVNKPLDLTLADLAGMPQTTVEANIYCVDFPSIIVTGGSWTGVKLSYILGEAGVYSSAVKVAFHAADGYVTDLDLETAAREDTIIAYELDGAPLSETLRLVVPGKWGYKWISQITRIAIVDYDFKGTWESQGYPDDAIAQITANHPPTQPESTPPNPTPSQTSEPTTPTSPPVTQPSDSSTLAPSEEVQNPKPEAAAQNHEPFPASWIVSAVAAGVVGASLLVYVKKRHK